MRTAHPEAEPFELTGDELDAALRDVGADPGDDALVARTLVAWEALLG